MSETWTEESSALYRELARVAVPDRAEQMAALVCLLPFERDEPFRAVELASGEGRLAHALLDAFPNATVLALDGSPSMRETTAQRLAPFGRRATVAAFDMASPDWYPKLDGADAVVSSLCVHHMDGGQKQALFRAVARYLSPRGAFLVADLVAPRRPEAQRMFAATWDRAARAQAGQAGNKRLYELFVSEHWNYFAYPDSYDKPSALFDQLLWLQAAGFDAVDCFWMRAGHAIYGGYRSTEARAADGITFADALRSAENALR